MKLKIPFQTQQHNAARNDCGAACVAMCAGVTTDKALTVTGKAGQQLHITDIMTALRAYRIDHDHQCPITLPDARALLTLGHPVVALVGYGRLPAELKAVDYDGNHYVVLAGYMVTGFYVHDPLQAQGYALWPDEALGYAWSNPTNAMPLQGIVVRQQREVVEPDMSEFGPVVATALDTAVATQYLQQLYRVLGVEGETMAEQQGHALAKLAMLHGGK